MHESARVAVIDDVDAVAGLARQAVAELTPLRGGSVWARREARAEPFEEALVAALDDPRHLVLAGTIDGVVVGYAVSRLEQLRDERPIAVVDDLYVDPEARGVGLGEALMNEIVAWARAHHCTGIDGFTLPGNRATKNFFETFGLTARAILVHRSLEDDTDR
jgi:GNAT superfamily N-acetyltransferase